jgi:hypothetical protein
MTFSDKGWIGGGSMTDKQPKKDPRLTAAEKALHDILDKLKKDLLAADDLQHEIQTLSRNDDDDVWYHRMLTTGIISSMVNDTCSPRVELIYELAHRVFHLPDHTEEQTEKQGEDNPVLH